MLNSTTHLSRSSEPRGESLTGPVLWCLAAGAGLALATRSTVATAMIREPTDVVILLAGAAAVIVGAWWLANVVAWSIALRRGCRVRGFTLPGTKRLAQLLLAASLTGACITDRDEGPAMVLVEQLTATTADPPTTTEPSVTTQRSTTTERLADLVSPPTNDTVDDVAPPSDTIDVEVEGAVAADFEGEGEGVRSIPAHRVIVTQGDNLWSLSVETLQRHGITDPSIAIVAEYWRLVVAANQVRSGDPDLIVPGETIDLPSHTLAS